jgi:hypothetical protein
MRAYDFALFVHLLGVVTLFAAVTLMQAAGARLRRAATVEHVRLWLGLARPVRVMFPLAGLLLLGTGLFMAAEAWTFATPWVAVSIVGFVAIAVGGEVQGRHFAAVGAAAAAAGEERVPSGLARLVARPAPWRSGFAMNGAAVGTLWLMATKPGWLGSVTAVLGLTAIGAIVGSAVVRPGPGGRVR